MDFKEYIKQLSKQHSPDSTDTAVVVQQLACLAALRLSEKGRLPLTCGTGYGIDMDIVNAGILAGLERLHDYDGSLGSLKAFLYPTISGSMQNYAWKRENRVTDGLWEFPMVYDSTPDSEESEVLIDEKTPETIVEDEEQRIDLAEALEGAMEYIGEEGSAMLLKAAQIGSDKAARIKWAEELGITYLGLATKLSRLRAKAREWALSVQ